MYRCMTSISKNMYNCKLDDIVNKSNNAYHSTSKMKSVDMQSSTYIASGNENNGKDSQILNWWFC